MNQSVIDQTIKYFKNKGIILPKISELRNPHSINKDIQNKLELININDTNPLNLFRVHWYNNLNQTQFAKIPEFIVLPSEFTGVDAKIIVNIGKLFPLISAHKVLPAYACILPRLLRGEFDYTNDKAVWPSTGNYCRGGVAISKILGLDSIAILPEGMSRERFNWLEKWLSNSKNIIKTSGTESNVKEIYDACNNLAKDPKNKIINQFTEYNNYSVHRSVTGPSFEDSFLKFKGNTNLVPKLYVAASGSSGTLGAGDYLKEKFNLSIAAVEPIECSTMLDNGYGDHNIQGIGDKHIPLIHNVMNTDFVVAVSDKATNNLNILFNTEIGHKYLLKVNGYDKKFVEKLPNFGFSSIANIIASIKLAKYMKLSSEDAIITVATDGSDLYETELDKSLCEFDGKFNFNSCENIFNKFFKSLDTDNMLELSEFDKNRIFNLGYYTWVEQQGISIEEFDIRRSQKFWDNKYNEFLDLDNEIDIFNSSILS
ncbi:MAG: pyridoxal-5'-phosphate-dependent protein subunit beta [Pelagibacteraceae bacterium]|nr:pyridoxal-5'-phosphate-dependent protein subunit beta [Pelagibacteraceae bacterium]